MNVPASVPHPEGDTGETPERSDPVRRRDARLDALRGFAVILMIIDHSSALAVLGIDAAGPLSWLVERNGVLWWVRHTLTRLSMPLFMLVSGYLIVHRRPSPRRRAEVGALGVALSVLLWWTWPTFGVPEILVVWSLCLFAAPLIVNAALPVAVLGVLQTINLPIGWGGYEPGLVAAFLALGVLWRALEPQTPHLFSFAAHLPGWVSAIGRRPLWWYSTHLVIFAMIARAVSS